MNFAVMVASFSLGLIAVGSPCVLPLYPGFLAYLSGRPGNGRTNYFLGLFVLLGLLTMMLLMSLVIALLSISVGRALSVIIPAADALIVALGVLLLFNKNPFQALPQVQVPALHHPFLNAWVYGMLYGPIALPCSGPLLVGMFTYSISLSDVISRLSVFLSFGFGFGLPLLVLSWLSAAMQRTITGWFSRHTLLFNRVGGSLLVGIGIYHFLANWSLIRIFLRI